MQAKFHIAIFGESPALPNTDDPEPPRLFDGVGIGKKNRMHDSHDSRLSLMVFAPAVAMLILGTGYVTAPISDRYHILVSATLAGCVATPGLVAAGSMVAYRSSLLMKMAALLFLSVNAAPVGLAVTMIGSILWKHYR